jgi:hypothetical protein
MKNILIVDNDLGFVCWLSSVLIKGDYQPWPSCSVSDAISVMGPKPDELDLVIVNPSLRGASSLIAQYRRWKVNLKVLALGHRGETRLTSDAWREKPVAIDRSSKKRWLRAVDRLTQTAA